ncbi:hypothetical protein M1141_03225, partial [Candidatus Marsarchaeota archaeon]|nr:hypothetical protein [Candidatus Marsarchaeota archaeon]
MPSKNNKKTMHLQAARQLSAKARSHAQKQNEPRCIICGEQKHGLPVQTDWVIESIRWFKKNITKNEKNYQLVVCKECYPKYKKMYSSYRNKQAFYIVLGAIFTALLFFASRYNIFSLISGLILLLFLYLLSLLSYMPALKMKLKNPP